jgi:hypothetical protein
LWDSCVGGRRYFPHYSYRRKAMEREFFVPARTLIGVILLMVIFCSFCYVALLHSTLDNVSMPWSWGWGTMAAAGQRRSPWLEYSFCALALKTYKCTYSYLKKGGQIIMSIWTFLEPGTIIARTVNFSFFARNRATLRAVVLCVRSLHLWRERAL